MTTSVISTPPQNKGANKAFKPSLECQIIEVIGHSTISFEDCLRDVLRNCHKSGHNIRGINVVGQNAKVSGEDNESIEYRIDAKVAVD